MAEIRLEAMQWRDETTLLLHWIEMIYPGSSVIVQWIIALIVVTVQTYQGNSKSFRLLNQNNESGTDAQIGREREK